MAKQTTSLPGGRPEFGDPKHAHLRWINAALDRDTNRIVAIQRFGINLDSNVRIEFEHGGFLRTTQRELFSAKGLANTLGAYDGHRPPAYTADDWFTVACSIVRSADTEIRDDDMHQLAADVGLFLRRALSEGGLLRGDYADNGYGVIMDLAAVNDGRSGSHHALAPALAFDTSAGALWVPRGPLAFFIRELRSKFDPHTLRASLQELGWQYANFQRRQPKGHGRPWARVWVVDPGWPACPFDLAAAVENARDARP